MNGDPKSGESLFAAERRFSWWPILTLIAWGVGLFDGWKFFA